MSNNVTPLGEGIGTKPVDNELLAKLGTVFMESARKRWQYVISRLTEISRK